MRDYQIVSAEYYKAVRDFTDTYTVISKNFDEDKAYELNCTVRDNFLRLLNVIMDTNFFFDECFHETFESEFELGLTKDFRGVWNAVRVYEMMKNRGAK